VIRSPCRTHRRSIADWPPRPARWRRRGPASGRATSPPRAAVRFRCLNSSQGQQALPVKCLCREGAHSTRAATGALHCVIKSHTTGNKVTEIGSRLAMRSQGRGGHPRRAPDPTVHVGSVSGDHPTDRRDRPGLHLAVHVCPGSTLRVSRPHDLSTDALAGAFPAGRPQWVTGAEFPPSVTFPLRRGSVAPIRLCVDP